MQPSAHHVMDVDRGEAPPPMSLEDSVANMAVIDAIFAAAETGAWVEIGRG